MGMASNRVGSRRLTFCGFMVAVISEECWFSGACILSDRFYPARQETNLNHVCQPFHVLLPSTITQSPITQEGFHETRIIHDRAVEVKDAVAGEEAVEDAARSRNSGGKLRSLGPFAPQFERGDNLFFSASTMADSLVSCMGHHSKCHPKSLSKVTHGLVASVVRQADCNL